jgi:pimeloyl-ACP methyl ester carboxylesterase
MPRSLQFPSTKPRCRERTPVAKALQLDAEQQQYATPQASGVAAHGQGLGGEPLLAHEIVRGALVRYSSPESREARQPPTAVLVHGIMGSKRNMVSFAKRLVEGFPTWQVVLVDLRCHGDSAGLAAQLVNQDHGVDAAAGDVLKLLQSLKMFPEILIGHSFGGKVVMSMAHQFGNGVTRLPRPVKVWVLDALPGEVRSAEMGGQDRPEDLISALRHYPLPVQRKSDIMTWLTANGGFSQGIAQWAATNLMPNPSGAGGFVWKVDLEAIHRMYLSYESTDLWKFLESPADGITVSFIRAERSNFRWSGKDQDLIKALGHDVHLLRDSGHWVHTDNPAGLFDIIAPSFGGGVDLHLRRAQPSLN